MFNENFEQIINFIQLNYINSENKFFPKNILLIMIFKISNYIYN